MGYNKVVFGNETLIDLTQQPLANQVAKNITFLDRDGNIATGTLEAGGGVITEDIFLNGTEESIIPIGTTPYVIEVNLRNFADKIKHNEVIFGTEGTLDTPAWEQVTATEQDVAVGKLFFDNTGLLLQGNLSERGSISLNGTQGNQINIPDGIYKNNKKIVIDLSNLQDKIKQGETIFGTTGTYSGGGGEVVNYELTGSVVLAVDTQTGAFQLASCHLPSNAYSWIMAKLNVGLKYNTYCVLRAIVSIGDQQIDTGYDFYCRLANTALDEDQEVSQADFNAIIGLNAPNQIQEIILVQLNGTTSGEAHYFLTNFADMTQSVYQSVNITFDDDPA